MAFPSEVLHLHLESLLQIEGLVHVYYVNTNYVLSNANPLQIEVIKRTCHLQSEKQIIGRTLKEIYQNLHHSFLETIYRQNAEVMQTKTAKVFYTLWSGKSVGDIKMVHCRMPVFNEKQEVMGIVGIAHYLTVFALPKKIKELLSQKELECVDLLLENKTAKQIAEKLNLSRRTVESYFDHVKNKLECDSKAQLIASLIYHKKNILETAKFSETIFD